MSVDSYSLDGYSLTDRNTLGKEKYLLWSSPNILWNAAITRKKYQLVLTTTIGDSKTIGPDVLNVLQMFSGYQQQYSFRVVIYSRSPAVLSFCRDHNITVITSYLVNSYGVPFVRYFLVQTKLLIAGHYYGYINSDILVSSKLFDLLIQCDNLIRQQVLPSKVAIGSRVFEIPLELVPSTLLNTSYVTVDMVNKVVELIVQNPKAVLRHQHSSDYFIYSESVDLTKITDIVIGRMRVDNGLLQYVRYQHGSLVDATNFVPAAHLGVCGFRCKMTSSKIPYLDKYWNIFYTQYFVWFRGTLRHPDYRF
ncbi:glycosyl transferase [Blastocystis sp. subtype 4]|uniref:glycosyl transferase n=1 Tax=Blastocystis sp. subtype 4 TaxID=944170 RepID=UPI0007122B17|nr:glycosyl transferase [Blastocystis sp. subtype 4]KNB43023.1 glycosyl transferase [Blastocystis sp. subtype 4]|eukprot:XP_014526466.1 glycosyl transferase [Blastocystis sp. subtype 4]